jgi:putative inorganic carbon (HCO3(-)) transporter
VSALTATQLAVDRLARRSRGAAFALTDLEPLLVGPAIAVGLMAPRFLGPALLFAAVFWVVRKVARGSLTVRLPGDWLIYVLIALVPVSLWVTPLPDVTRNQALLLLTGIATYFALLNWARTFRRERVLVFAVVGAGLFAALVAPVAVVWVTDIKLTFIPESIYARLPLLVANPAHPNVLAGTLVLALPVPLALLMFAGAGLTRLERVAAIAAAVGMTAILVLTKSRGGMIAAFVAALVLCLLRWRRAWLVMLLAALLGALMLWRAGFDDLTDTLLDNGAIIGVPGRLELWSRAIYMVQDFPLTGIGMGSFETVANRLYPFFLLGPDADAPHAHNIFLQVAVDLGIPGFAAWLGLLVLAALRSGQVLAAGRREGDAWSAGLGAGLLAAQFALAVHGIVDAAVWGAHSGIAVWGLWAICAVAYNLRASPRSPVRPGGPV